MSELAVSAATISDIDDPEVRRIFEALARATDGELFPHAVAAAAEHLGANLCGACDTADDAIALGQEAHRAVEQTISTRFEHYRRQVEVCRNSSAKPAGETRQGELQLEPEGDVGTDLSTQPSRNIDLPSLADSGGGPLPVDGAALRRGTWTYALAARDLATDLMSLRERDGQISAPMFLDQRDLVVELLRAEFQRIEASSVSAFERKLDAIDAAN